MSIKDLNNTPDTTAEFDPNDIEQNKVMAILAYLGILVLVPILAAPQSKFARYHANQGLVLAIGMIAWGIIYGILTSIFTLISIWLGILFSWLLGLVWIPSAVLAILGIINAANGKAKELPILGKFKILN